MYGRYAYRWYVSKVRVCVCVCVHISEVIIMRSSSSGVMKSDVSEFAVHTHLSATVKEINGH